MPAKRCVIAAALAVALSCMPEAAWAADGHGSETPSGSAPGISANAGLPGGYAAGGSAGSSDCTWEVLNNPNNPDTATPPPPTVIGGETATLYVRSCGTAVDLVWVVPITGAAAVPAAEADVRKLLPVPTPRMVPPDTDPHGFTYTQVPLWWWLPSDQWHPVSATATATNGPQTVSATVTAAPSQIQFDPGDGSGTVVCPGPGVPFDRSKPLSAQSTPCQYTYRQSSSTGPTGTFPATWTVVWTVSWTASDGTGGTLPALQTTTTRDLAVAEDQSVLVNPDS